MKFVSPLSTTSSVDFSAASSTKPNKTGTTLPETCAVGDTFIDTDATAGQNFYVCLSENVWTLQGGGGSDAVTAAGTLTSSAPVIGSGSKAVAVGSRSGNTTEFATISGTKTASKQLKFDASGNVTASATDIGAGSGDASGMTLLHSTVNGSITGTDAAQTVATYTIPSGTLQAGDTVRMEAFLRRTAGSGTDANLMASMGNGGTPVYGTTISTDAHYIIQWHVTGSTSVTATGLVLRSLSVPASMPLDAGDHYTVPTDFDVASNNVIALKSSGSHIDADTTYALGFFRVWRIRQP